VLNVEFAPVFAPLFKPARFKISDGGRGGGRSWAFARYLLLAGAQASERVLCCREYQTSIASSVHQLLKDQVEHLGLESFYTVTRDNIVGANGTLFLFKGLHHNAADIKSTEGITKCWVEEAEKVSDDSWSFLIPTIRLPCSEILITFNPYKETDPTYERFILNPPPGTVRMRAGWAQNPWFPDVLKTEMEHDRTTNWDKYQWIWEGNPRGISNAQVFKGKYVVDDFEVPADVKLYLGADWGFSADPTTLIQSFIADRILYIASESYGVGVEIDALPGLFDRVQGSRKWKIYADSARPETISYMKRQGYSIEGCKKWPGSVEDGIEFMKAFEKIVIHPRCINTLQEFELYQYKQDKQTNEILPGIVDKNNHCMDAIRYSLQDYITKRGASIPKTNIRRRIGI
jgi:phage terminase large subunit